MSTVKTVFFLTTATLLTVVFTAYLRQKKKKKIVVPANWKPIGRVSKLFIYPLKSGRRYELNEARCTDFGFEEAVDGNFHHPLRDRQFVVYNANDREFRTARTYPKLVLIEVTALDTKKIVFKAPEMENLTIELPKLEKSNEITISLHKGEKIQTYDCGNEAGKWISKYTLGKDSGLRIGYQNGSFERNLKEKHSNYLKVFEQLNNAKGLYSDISNYLVVNKSSIDDLNERMEEGHVTVNHFRPNIIMDGANPYDEDKWDVIKVGNIIFYKVMPCTRCVLTTVDPDKGERDPKHEPLTTLSKYRKLKDPAQRKVLGDSPAMGVYFNPLDKNGTVKVGDEIFVGVA